MRKPSLAGRGAVAAVAATAVCALAACASPASGTATGPGSAPSPVTAHPASAAAAAARFRFAPMTWVDTGTDLIYISSDSSTDVATKLVDRSLGTGQVRWSTTLGGDGTYAMVVRPAGRNLIVAEAPGLPSTATAALAVDPATGHVSATARLASLGETPLTVAGGDTLLELTAAACPEPASPASQASPTSAAAGHPAALVP